MNDGQKNHLFEKLHALPDYYQDFDICTWACINDEDELAAVLSFLDEYPQATTVDVINFQEWLEDQLEANS